MATGGTRIDGLASGIDTSSLIESMLAATRRPIKRNELKIAELGQKKTALGEVTAHFLGLMGTTSLLTKPGTFASRVVSSSNDAVLSASLPEGSLAAPGRYSFRVTQLARSQQLASRGYADRDTTPLGAGSIALDLGNTRLVRDTRLEELNGGLGAARGRLKITDRSGAAATVDLTAAVTVADAIQAINNTAGIAVRARVSNDGDHLVLEDRTGQIASDLKVEEVGTGRTAQDLGLKGQAAANMLTGADVYGLGDALSLNALRDGLGVLDNNGTDFNVTVGAIGFAVDLGTARTLGDVRKAIESAAAAAGAQLSVGYDAATNALKLVDDSGAGNIQVTDISGAAANLGLLGSTPGTVLTGQSLLGGMETVLVGNLRGGAGLGLGLVQLGDRGGATAQVDLAGARSLNEVLARINGAGLGLSASIDRTGTGVKLADTTGLAAANLIFTDVSGTAAADLGLNTGAGGVAAASVEGGHLRRRFIDMSTALSTLNAGRGVFAGRFEITNRAGQRFTVDLRQDDDTRIEDVITEINAFGGTYGVTAAINAAGDGIVLTDASGGGERLSVRDLDGGRTARDLRLAGSAAAATPTTIDGSFRRVIQVGASDTLDDLADKINALDIAVRATVFNDGSARPYRLSLSSEESGLDSRFAVSEDLGLDLEVIGEAQDAKLLFGDPAGNPLLVSSRTNQLAGTVGGLDLTLTDVGNAVVDVTKSRGSVAEQVEKFVNQYNALQAKLKDLMKYDVETGARGLLAGNATVRGALRQVTQALSEPFRGEGGVRLAVELGIKLTARGDLTFNASKLGEALDRDPEAVESFFAGYRPLEADSELAEFNSGSGVTIPEGQAAFRLTLRNATELDIDLTGVTTLQGVLDRINNHALNGGKLVARIADGDQRLELVDSTTGVNDELTVTQLSGSTAAGELGLTASPDGGTILGRIIHLNKNFGLGHRLVDLLESITATGEGLFAIQEQGIDKRIESLEDANERQQERIDRKEQMLIKKFANMEAIMQQSQEVMQRLSAQLAGLSSLKRK